LPLDAGTVVQIGTTVMMVPLLVGLEAMITHRTDEVRKVAKDAENQLIAATKSMAELRSMLKQAESQRRANQIGLVDEVVAGPTKEGIEALYDQAVERGLLWRHGARASSDPSDPEAPLLRVRRHVTATTGDITLCLDLPDRTDVAVVRPGSDDFAEALIVLQDEASKRGVVDIDVATALAEWATFVGDLLRVHEEGRQVKEAIQRLKGDWVLCRNALVRLDGEAHATLAELLGREREEAYPRLLEHPEIQQHPDDFKASFVAAQRLLAGLS